jgi:eukaryotic-like serine/threonine-protein kinase
VRRRHDDGHCSDFAPEVADTKNAGKVPARTKVMHSDPVELGPDSMVGSYRVVKAIGRGGMGGVYEAVHTVLPRRAALKVMHAELRRHPGMATRMVQEAAILEEIRHPGVVRVYECSILPDHRPWIAMELVEGDTLATRLHYTSRLPAIEVAALLVEIADVLAWVHARGVIHRDLKPDNVILVPGDRTYPLRLIDWGVARLGTAGRLTLDGLTPGTPIYMSPEQAHGKQVTPACDLYSLGVIAYEALTGHPPFDGRTLAEVVCMHLHGAAVPLAELCDAPPALCELVHHMLEKNPDTRPGAIEVRQLARAIAPSARSAALSISDVRIPSRPAIPTDEVVIVDPDALEYGVTEMLPIVRAPRWTPDLGSAVPLALPVDAMQDRSKRNS